MDPSARGGVVVDVVDSNLIVSDNFIVTCLLLLLPREDVIKHVRIYVVPYTRSFLPFKSPISLFRFATIICFLNLRVS